MWVSSDCSLYQRGICSFLSRRGQRGGSFLSTEQIESALIARSTLDDHPGSKSSCVLIDDYNTSQKSFDPVVEQLEQIGTRPDVICSEASLIDTALNMIDHMPDSRIRRSILRYLNSHGKWPCSMLTASWYAVRLDLLPVPSNLVLAGDVDSVFGERLINILDIQFAGVEREALRIVDEFHLGASNSIEFRGIEVDILR